MILFLELKTYNVEHVTTRQGGSNEYPHFMFWKNNKKNVFSFIPQFSCINEGLEGVYTTRTCYRDGYVFKLLSGTGKETQNFGNAKLRKRVTYRGRHQQRIQEPLFLNVPLHTLAYGLHIL